MEAKLSNIRLSTVVPGQMTVENTVHHLTNTDLAMKHHYIKAVYFFNNEFAELGLIISDLKTAMSHLLSRYFTVAGRIRRRPEDNRPFIKCNDGGVRVVEAESNTSIDEWVEMKHSDVSELAYRDHVLGPDLQFSPLLFLQFTKFKCGGFSVGLNWSHVIGDAFSTSTFVNMWAQIVNCKTLSHISISTKLQISERPSTFQNIDLVGNHWFNVNNTKMVTFSLHISSKNLDQITSKANAKPFQALCATIWKSLAKIRAQLEPKTVTICTYGSQKNEIKSQGNNQRVSKVVVDFTVSEASVIDLAELITVKQNNSDAMFYGETLTFVNLEEAKLYGFELKGHKPVLANYAMTGVGDEGVALVLQGPENYRGRLLTMTLPSDQVVALKNELIKEWNIGRD
ncbi:Chloramphenicol acetyltransferase-like domain-containing protein [Cynara cardunculus var. scolymus]|uniref:Chloramphenicol acetyltransferase-like domain-containing protein n=1 Tax=Cynara cardunculus var. scolymus TaxID=59895 RepID=A0A118JZS7_CYNCS|nr:Chloramphenicol acetyltransferase-like domain-containing protein [Cynara cardunculus var. scolymus]